MPLLPFARLPRAAFFALLACALLLAQGLGLAHRSLHAAASAGSHVARGAGPATAGMAARPSAQVGSVGAAAATDAPLASPLGWLQALIDQHDPGKACDAYDQCTHADSHTPPALVWALLGVTHLPTVGLHAGIHLAAQAAGFLARGPPAA